MNEALLDGAGVYPRVCGGTIHCLADVAGDSGLSRVCGGTPSP